LILEKVSNEEALFLQIVDELGNLKEFVRDINETFGVD